MGKNKTVGWRRRGYKEKKRLMNDIVRLLAKNYNDHEIADQLDLPMNTLTKYKKEILNRERLEIENANNAEIYADFCQKMSQLIKELDAAKNVAKTKSQITAMVAAIKQKKECFESIMKYGQEMGFIKKEATKSKVEFSGGLTFSTMSEEDVRKEIKKELESRKKMLQAPIDVRPELLGVMDEDVKKFIPKEVANMPDESEVIVMESQPKKKTLLRR